MIRKIGERMENFLAFPVKDIPFVALTLIIAFSIHEFAHAAVAYKFGDPTAKNQGRLTLSPLSHLDVFGTLLIFIAGFGWAKPVPVNRFYFKKPRLAGVLVSVAGPLSNLLLAFIGLSIWYALMSMGIIDGVSGNIYESLYRFFDLFVLLNIILFVFNLFPFPPLDGYRIIEDLVPQNIRAKMTQYETYGILFFIILVITPLDQYTIRPVFQTVIPGVLRFLDALISPIFF